MVTKQHESANDEKTPSQEQWNQASEEVEKNIKKVARNFSLLKQIDQFKQPVKILLNRQNKETKEKIHTETLGSIAGGILSLTAITLLTLYLIYLSFRMTNGKDDVNRTMQRANEFLDGSESFDLSDS